MMRKLLFLFLLLPAVSVFAEDSAMPPPEILVRQMVGEVLSSIKQDRGITHDMMKMDELVEAKVLPQVDFPRMTRLTIGGKYWIDATPQEQQQLVDEFRTFLSHVFSDVIIQYTNQTIIFTPLHMHPEEKDITVKTWVIDPNDEPTKLDYQMEKTASGWMIYDVSIDNMSLIKIYRSNFSDELLKGGVPSLVGTLHKKNQEVGASSERKDAGKSKPESRAPAASAVE